MDPIELELQRKYGSVNATNIDPIEAELAQKYGTSTTPVESTGFKPLTMEDIGSVSPSSINKSVTLPKSNYKPEMLSSSAGYFQATPKVRVRDVVREGANILGSGYKIVGDALASGLASKSKDVKGAMDSLSTLQDQQTKLGILISKMKKEGKDTSKLQKIFDDNNKYIKDNGGMASIIPAVEMTNKQLAGGLAEVGLDAITAGTSGLLAKNMKSFKVAKPLVSKVTLPTVTGQFKAGAKAIVGGGALGYGYDVSNKLQMEEEKPFKPGIGTAIGAGIPTLGLAGKFSKGSKVEKIVSGRLKELDKLSNTKIGLKKAVSNAKKKGIDVIDIISKSDLLDGAVDNTGTVSTKVEGGAVSQVMDQIRPYEDAVRRNLEIEGNTINIQNIKDKLIEAINNSSLKAGNKSTALSAIKKELSGLMLDAGETGDVPISLIHDSKIDKYSTINYDNPQSSKIDKIIAEAYKKIVEDNTTVIPVKKINQELSKFYTIKKFLEKLDGSKVEGGRLGKYFARTIGGIAGSQFGPLGALAGSELGGLIKGASMAKKFRGKTGKMLNISDDLIGAVDFQKNAGEVMKSKINRPYPIALPEANKSVIMAKEAPDASRLYSQEEAVAYLKDSGFGSGKVDTRDSFTKWADEEFGNPGDNIDDLLMGEANKLKKEENTQLLRDIRELGGISSYNDGFLSEELKNVPLNARNNKGIALDEIVSELNNKGYNYADSNELLSDLQKRFGSNMYGGVLGVGGASAYALSQRVKNGIGLPPRKEKDNIQVTANPQSENVNPQSQTTFSKDVADTVFSEAGNNKDEMSAMFLTIMNRAKRLKERNKRDFTFDDVVSIPDQYEGRTNSQYQKAKSGNLDGLSKDKYDLVLESINNINEIKDEIGDFDSFSKGLPEGVTDYVKIGEHYFYKSPSHLRTQ